VVSGGGNFVQQFPNHLRRKLYLKIPSAM
jgi:hypothetical protein